MQTKNWGAWLALCVVASGSLWSAPTGAEAQEVKEKPPMYTYVSNWIIPRGRWADMDKQVATDAKVFDKGMAGGGLVAYGNDVTLVHQAEGETHDTFWSAMSVAAILGVLEELHKAGASAAPVLSSATKHWDELYVSRFYNWKSGSMKDGYTHVASYKLKADAPQDAVETLSKSVIVPLLEKQLTDGTLLEYEVDTQAIHTTAPGTFWIAYITPTAAGVDKVRAAIAENLKANPLVGPAFGSLVDFSEHRDYLFQTNAVYK